MSPFINSSCENKSTVRHVSVVQNNRLLANYYFHNDSIHGFEDKINLNIYLMATLMEECGLDSIIGFSYESSTTTAVNTIYLTTDEKFDLIKSFKTSSYLNYILLNANIKVDASKIVRIMVKEHIHDNSFIINKINSIINNFNYMGYPNNSKLESLNLKETNSGKITNEKSSDLIKTKSKSIIDYDIFKEETVNLKTNN